MELKELVQKADEVTRAYDELNSSKGFPKWTLQEYVQGFVEDVGSLTRLTMMKSGLRENTMELELDEKLRHEICDCLWSTLRIARDLDIDLEKEFPRQMDTLLERIKTEGH